MGFLFGYDSMLRSYHLRVMRPTSVARPVSDPTAAGGGRREGRAVQRSVCNAAAPSARRTPGTANRDKPPINPNPTQSGIYRVHGWPAASGTDAGLRESVCAEISLQNRLTHILTHNRIAPSGQGGIFRTQCPSNPKNREIIKIFEKYFPATDRFSTQCSKPLPDHFCGSERGLFVYFVLIGAI